MFGKMLAFVESWNLQLPSLIVNNLCPLNCPLIVFPNSTQGVGLNKKRINLIIDITLNLLLPQMQVYID